LCRELKHKGTRKKIAVGEISGKGLKVEGLERVGMGHRRDGKECREMKRAKIKGWANGKRV
jgi:hypothetical protein